MKRQFLLAALAVAAAACSKDAALNTSSDENVASGPTEIVAKIKTGDYSSTRAAGPMTTDGTVAYFDVNALVNVTVYGNPESSFTNYPNQTLVQTDDSSAAGDLNATYQVVFQLQDDNKSRVDLSFNGDEVAEDATDAKTKLSGNVNSRQGTLRSTTGVNTNTKVRIVPTEDAGNGDITVTGNDATATLTVAPEMARLEMVNTDLVTDAQFAAYKAEEVEFLYNDGVTVGKTTKAAILSQYKDLQITRIFQDNVYETRSASDADFAATTFPTGSLGIVDSNDDSEAGWDLNNSTSSTTNYGTVGKLSTMWDAIATPLNITDAATTNLSTVFGASTSNSVGYNIFPQAQLAAGALDPATAANVEAAKAEHPHYIVEVKYYPATAVDRTLTALGHSTTPYTRYINLAAFRKTNGDLISTFTAGSVYQFELADLLNTIMPNDETETTVPEIDPTPDPTDPEDPYTPPTPPTPPTIDPDKKDITLTMTVNVLDWVVVPVTPLPL